MKKFLTNLGITKAGHYGEDGSYIIDFNNSYEFGKVYSILDNSDELESIDESTLLNEDNASFNFTSDDFQISLTGDFNNDIYKLVIVENKGDN